MTPLYGTMESVIAGERGWINSGVGGGMGWGCLGGENQRFNRPITRKCITEGKIKVKNKRGGVKGG